MPPSVNHDEVPSIEDKYLRLATMVTELALSIERRASQTNPQVENSGYPSLVQVWNRGSSPTAVAVAVGGKTPTLTQQLNEPFHGRSAPVISRTLSVPPTPAAPQIRTVPLPSASPIIVPQGPPANTTQRVSTSNITVSPHDQEVPSPESIEASTPEGWETYYVVTIGRRVGIFRSWFFETLTATHGIRAVHKSFTSREAAINFYTEAYNQVPRMVRYIDRN